MCLGGSQDSALQQGQPDPFGPHFLAGDELLWARSGCKGTAGGESGAEGRISPPAGKATAPRNCIAGKSTRGLALRLPWDLLADKHRLDVG